MADDPATPTYPDIDPSEETIGAEDLPPLATTGLSGGATAISSADDGEAPPSRMDAPIDDVQYGATPLQISRASLATNTPTRIKRYSEMLGIPVGDFATNKSGDIVRKMQPKEQSGLPQDDDIPYVRVEPTLTGGKGAGDQLERAGDFAASGLGQAIPMATGAAGSLLSSPTLGGMVAGGAAGAGIGEIWREGIDKAISGEDPNFSSLDYPNIAGQTALGAVTPIAGAFGGRALGRGIPNLTDTAIQTAAQDNPGFFNKIASDSASPFVDWLKGLTYDNPLDLNGPTWNSVRSSITPEEMANITATRQAAARDGIDLDLGQVTGQFGIMKRVRQLLRSPETDTQAASFRANQQGVQVPAAFLKTVNEILPAGNQVSQEDAINAFRSGSNDIVQKAINQKIAEGNLNFGTALDKIPNDPTSGVPARYWTPELQEILETDPGRKGVANAIANNNTFPASQRPNLTVPTYDPQTGALQKTGDFVPTWRAWDQIRKGIKSIVDENTDEYGKMNEYGRNVYLNTYKPLVANLTEKNEAYGTALGLYGDASDAVNTVLNGGVGKLQKMTGMDRQGILDRFFSSQNIMPKDMAAARDLFHTPDPTTGAPMWGDQWDAATSAWMRGKLSDALAPRANGADVGNVAGKLYGKLYGTPEDRQLMAAALGDPEKVDRLDKFMTTLNAASRYLPEGSPTASDLPQIQSQAGQAARTIGKMFDLKTYSQLGSTVVEGMANMFDRNARSHTLDYLLSSEGDDMLKQMANLKPSSIAARQMLGQVFVNAGVAGSGRIRDLFVPGQGRVSAPTNQPSP